MPLSTAFYTNEKAPAPAMFQQLDEQARLLNAPPPVPDLFRRPITPAVAQPNDPPPQIDQPQTPPSNSGGTTGGGQGGTASQMAAAMLLYQMLQGGGAGGFLGRLGVQPGSGFGSRLGQQGNAFAGLNDPSIAALFNKQSYFKPTLGGAVMRGQDPEAYRQFYGGGGAMRMGDRNPTFGVLPDVYQNALTFLSSLLGLQV